MITYTELTDAVIGNLEIDSNELDRYQVVENLNRSQLEILNTLPTRFISNVVKNTWVNFSAGVSMYKWPNDFLRFVKLWINYSAPVIPEKGKEATIYKSENFFKNLSDIGTQNFPFVDIEIEGGYEIAPTPNGDLDYGGYMRYVWKPQPISSNQNSLLNYNLKNLLVNRAIQLSCLMDNYRPDLAKEFEKLFDKELAKFMPKKEKQ